MNEDKNNPWTNKGMITGALIGITAGLVIGSLAGGKEKVILLSTIGLFAGAGIGYGGKKFIKS